MIRNTLFSLSRSCTCETVSLPSPFLPTSPLFPSLFFPTSSPSQIRLRSAVRSPSEFLGGAPAAAAITIILLLGSQSASHVNIVVGYVQCK